jgi:hypothetical protein
MSLNRCEQMTLDYVMNHIEERQFWMEKVRSTARTTNSDHETAAQVEIELWAYFCERSSVVEPFRSSVPREGLKRISMRNLADYWIRLWTPPRKKTSANVQPQP